MIWFILALIVSLVILIKEKSFGSFLCSLCIGCAIALVVGCSIRAIMPDQFEIIREERLIKINDDESYVSIMNNDNSVSDSCPTLVFTVETKEGSIATYKTDLTDDFGIMKIIIETDSVEPKYVRQKMRPMYEYWRWFSVNLSGSRYILYIPKDSLEYDYNVK